MKKWWLVLVMALTLCCGAAAAEISGDWEYVLLDDGTAEIYAYYGQAEQLTVPAELDGHAVSKLGGVCFAENAVLRSVTIPDTVTEIGRNPFLGCPCLTEIIVSQDHPTLATIGGVLFHKPTKTLVTYPCAFIIPAYEVPQGILAIGEDAFFGSPLTSVILPDTLTDVRDMAFRKCQALESVVLPESVTYIGMSAFNECAALRSINIPAGVKDICDGAFAGCWSLQSVALPEGLQTIGDYAFSGCENLTAFTFPSTVGVLGSGVFEGCHGLTEIVLPDTLRILYGNPFPNCSKLTEIVVSPDHPTLATIDGVLFMKADKRLVCYPRALTAESYAVPQGIRVIGKQAFYVNTVLKEIILPDTLEEIGMEAFSNTNELESIVLPDGLKEVGVWAFLYCRKLTEITVPASVTAIGQEAFTTYNGVTVHTWRGSYAAQWARDNGVPYDYVDALDWLTN